MVKTPFEVFLIKSNILKVIKGSIFNFKITLQNINNYEMVDTEKIASFRKARKWPDDFWR